MYIVTDMANSTLDNSLCLQFADDSTIHRHWKANDINHCCREMQTDMNNTNLVFTVKNIKK